MAKKLNVNHLDLNVKALQSFVVLKLRALQKCLMAETGTVQAQLQCFNELVDMFA